MGQHLDLIFLPVNIKLHIEMVLDLKKEREKGQESQTALYAIILWRQLTTSSYLVDFMWALTLSNLIYSFPAL